MRNLFKSIPLIILLTTAFLLNNNFAQAQEKKAPLSKREKARRAMHSRDSLLKSINKSDTSINSLLQRIQQYTNTYNQINNNLAQGFDTSDVSSLLPPVIKRINKITTLGNAHKSSTLRYLFVLRDNLDHIQGDLEDWQTDLNSISTKLVQNQSDLLKFTKDSLRKTAPSDSLVRETFFAHLKGLRQLWSKVDSTNRTALLKVNLLQDKISVAYTNTLDESDHIDAKIKSFALKAISGESTYIWIVDGQYNNFNSAFNNTIKLNQLLFSYFIKNELPTHLVALLFLVLFFTWIFYTRTQVIRNNEQPDAVFSEAPYIYKRPAIAALLVVTAITPYFYDHPPTVFLEILFLVSMILALILIKKEFPRNTYKFLLILFALSIVYCVSNLFIEISNVDRYVTFLLSILSLIAGFAFHKRVKKSPDGQIQHTGLAIKAFIGLQVLSLILNITGRFSLAKIIGVTAISNLWFLIILYLVIKIMIEGLYLQFKLRKEGNSLINWIDYEIVKKKFRNTLFVMASIVWLFFLLQNLNIDDWVVDYGASILNDSQTIGGASFTFGGFVIFIFVIWLSSVVSKIISYFYDISAQRVSDLSVAKKKNRTSALLIRMAVFSAGFLLAVAASGFPLEKLTIIISAFGVGIGFGLQNIVNNLVSGLILAFEKPINIGDVIEVDGVSGTMREIGIRSSKIATGDGSEVIIPNGDLISHHVTNWTLSNTNRQISLLINTAYGVDIDKVKDMLKNLLVDREDIMAAPAPSVFVNNVSASSVEFKVLFWAADIGTVSSLKSKIFSDIYKEIKNQEIDMPSSQKDFYLHFPDGEPFLKIDKPAEKVKDKDATVDKIKENPSGSVK